jgi:phage head maturation protease
MVANVDVENNTTARELKSAIERGDISGMSFMFSVDDADQDWVDMDTDHPTRHIRKISSVVEVSAVTFPAYEATSINTRCKEALESARSTVETARQQRNVEPLESDIDLDLAKAKLNFIARQ